MPVFPDAILALREKCPYSGPYFSVFGLNTERYGYLSRSAVHSIPQQGNREDGQDAMCNQNTVGKLYSGKVFYSIKYIANQGSSTVRGVTVVAARPVAGHFYRNPVETRHCIANLGL